MAKSNRTNHRKRMKSPLCMGRSLELSQVVREVWIVAKR